MSAAIGALGAAGNTITQNRLWNYLKSERVHPSLLLVGPDPKVKIDSAKGIAKFLLCKNRGQKAYCGACSSCLRIEKEIHPDVLIIRESEEDSLKVDAIRELSHQMAIAPLESDSKICIIDECHRMNTASSNAFLKTLEEPGVGRYFLLLTTQGGSLLPTILSRCLVFNFKPENELTLAPAEMDQFQALLAGYLGTKNSSALVAALEDKHLLQRFVRYLQAELRENAIRDISGQPRSGPLKNLDSYQCTRKFDELVALEGRLRSNANYGLMLESLMRQNFA